jgi:hypothetical protein
MQSAPIETEVTESVSELPEEVVHVPLWVKGIVAGGAILFATQIPTFAGSLSDAIQKSRASKAYDNAQYSQAIARYKDLGNRYPADKNLTKRLAFSFYRAGSYAEAIDTFSQLGGTKMPKREIEEIEAAVADILNELSLQSTQVR